MGPDPTRAYFWSAENKRPTHLWLGVTFWPNPKWFFLSKGEKIEKFDVFRGNFLNPNHRWLTQPEPQKFDADLVMGPGQNFLAWVGSGQFFVARVGSGQPSMVWVWILKISPKNVKFFHFFLFGSKKIASGRVGKYPGRPLIYCGSSLGQVGSGPISTRTHCEKKLL